MSTNLPISYPTAGAGRGPHQPALPQQRTHQPPAPASLSHPEPALALARQKADFVCSVYSLARSDKIAAREAAAIIAARHDLFPLLQTGGKNGASLLAGSRGYSNYRNWLRALGKTETGAPAHANHAALVPGYVGARRYVRPGPPEFWTTLANLYEHPNKLSLRYAYRLTILALTPEAHQSRPRRPCVAGAQDSPPSETQVSSLTPHPSYNQVSHHYAKHVDRKRVILAREGEEYFRNQVAGFIDRAAPDPDECWFSDHHIFDAAIRVFDHETGQWRPVRPWLTAWMDWGALYFIGYQIRPIYPNRDAIERALRAGLERNDGHPPVHLYIDNGKDYQSLGFARPLQPDDRDRLTSVADLLGCRVHFALPYNARAKVIERMFRVVCEQFSKLWTSYRGSSPERRPETADAAWKDVMSLPTLAEFSAAFDAWLATVYHSEPGHGKTLAGKSPAAVRAAAKHLRAPLDPTLRYKAFLREIPGARTIHRGGVVTALKRAYRSDQLFTLLCNRENKVRVKVDPDNLDTIWIYSLDGREIGPATAAPRLPALIDHDTEPETVETLREELKRQRRQLRAAKDASAAARNLSHFHVAPDISHALPGHVAAPDKAWPSPPEHRLPPSRAPRSASEASAGLASPEDLANLDAALREQTTARLAALNQGDPDPDVDLAFLDALEAERLADLLSPYP